MNQGKNALADRWSGALWGLAIGDAWGFQVEFMSHESIVRQHGVSGPEFPASAIISDDTQMTLALYTALREAPPAGQPMSEVRQAIWESFKSWSVDPDNNRAPGNTCMGALRALAQWDPAGWVEASRHHSKGCGANMRVAPAAFLANEETAFGVAAFQAALTHGHPTGLAAAVLTTYAIRLAATLTPLTELASEVHAKAVEWSAAPTPSWWEMWLPEFDWPGQFGFGECVEVLRRASSTPIPTVPSDPCADINMQGWIAEEALALALYSIRAAGGIAEVGTPIASVRRAATSNGDSDSIACITGAIVGAAKPNTWEPDWLRRFEPRYRAEIGSAASIRPDD